MPSPCTYNEHKDYVNFLNARLGNNKTKNKAVPFRQPLGVELTPKTKVTSCLYCTYIPTVLDTPVLKNSDTFLSLLMSFNERLSYLHYLPVSLHLLRIEQKDPSMKNTNLESKEFRVAVITDT